MEAVGDYVWQDRTGVTQPLCQMITKTHYKLRLKQDSNYSHQKHLLIFIS